MIVDTVQQSPACVTGAERNADEATKAEEVADLLCIAEGGLGALSDLRGLDLDAYAAILGFVRRPQELDSRFSRRIASAYGEGTRCG